jgi:hypothetical protein
MFDGQRKPHHDRTMIVECEVREAEIAAPANAHLPVETDPTRMTAVLTLYLGGVTRMGR